MEINEKILELIRRRGIEGDEEIEEFFSDKPKETYDPFLLPDMEAGVDLVLSAIDEGKKICIYGDYDCDGVTSTVILKEVLSELTDDIMEYIPSRFDEGYGLNKGAIDTIKENGAELIITVDCGSVSVDEVEYAKSLGLDIMVTDHHQITDRMADTILINPARPDSEYPFRYLAGCGVAFKFAQAIQQEAGIDKRIITSTLDLVALGTIGDIVPLLHENRMLAKYGIRAMNTSKREALKILIEKVGLRPGEVTAENVSFILVPHINAAGRMHSASVALKLFLAKTREEMEKYADELVKLNRERKDLQGEVYRRAEEIAENEYEGRDFLVIDLGDAHEGVTGIAAGKLKEKFGVPAVIVTDAGDGLLKGTGRSPEGIDLYELLKGEEEWFRTFGGHAAACGFTMRKEGLSEIRTDLEEKARELKEKDPGLFDNEPEAELDIEKSEINLGFIEGLEALEPCGCKNERPLISVHGRPGDIYPLGKEGRFLRFGLDVSGVRLSCVDFTDVDKIKKRLEEAAASGGEVEVLGYMGRHEWNGNVSVQMNVKAAR